MDPEEKEKAEKRDWLAEKIQTLNTQNEGFEADLEKVVSCVCAWACACSLMQINVGFEGVRAFPV